MNSEEHLSAGPDSAPADDPIYRALYRYTRALSVALGYRDLLTRLHSERVRSLSETLALEVGLPRADVGFVRIAASFHDIGKIGIPDRILQKPSALDAQEWATMTAHSAIGEEIIAAIELEGSSQAARIIRHHHEHWDGSGYPDGRSGADIPLASRIIAVADSYDGMAVTRAYHAARGHREIMAVLAEEAGIKLDPSLVAAFAEFIETSPLKVAEI